MKTGKNIWLRILCSKVFLYNLKSPVPKALRVLVQKAYSVFQNLFLTLQIFFGQECFPCCSSSYSLISYILCRTRFKREMLEFVFWCTSSLSCMLHASLIKKTKKKTPIVNEACQLNGRCMQARQTPECREAFLDLKFQEYA